MARAQKSSTRTRPPKESDAKPPLIKGSHPEALFDIVARSQRGFRALIDSFDWITFNVSLDGKIRVINRKFTEVAGLPFREIVDHSISEFVVEPSREEMSDALPALLEKRSWSGIVRVRWRGSEEIHFYDCTLYAAVDEARAVSVTGVARDITSQQTAEWRFKELFETLHEGVYFASPDGELLDVNPAAVRMLGYETKEELLIPPASRHFETPADHQTLISDLQRCGFVRDRRLTLRRKDGSLLHARNSSVAIRDASGQFVRFQGSLVDITERELMQERLREEQEFVRRLVACFPDIITVLDTSGRYTFVSPRVREVLGYTPEEFIGLHLQDRPHPEDRSSLLEFFKRLTSGEMSVGTIEYRTAHKEGRWRTIRAHASPLTNAERKIIGIVASARDVTESLRLEEQLLQSEKLAAVGQMVSGVAHELNNPLTAILGVSDLLRERATDDASRRQTDIIHKQARKAADLVQGLLMFSRPSKPHSQSIRVTDLIARALELRKTELQARHITVHVEASADLPPVDANPNHMVQVFVNILANAEQAIASARDYGQIVVCVARANGKQEILFDDDGPGIAPEIRSKIFDPFFTTHRSTGSSGLGLTIALVIVKDHGGTIEAQTSPSGGARLRILLPVAETVQVVSPASVKKRLEGRAILVIDDEEGIRELTNEGLKTHGAIVTSVESAEEAWECLQRTNYDVVVCDFNLGNESGRALFERIKNAKKNAAPKFVFMTGELLDASQMVELRKRGAHALQKPFQMSDLIAAIETAFSP